MTSTPDRQAVPAFDVSISKAGQHYGCNSLEDGAAKVEAPPNAESQFASLGGTGVAVFLILVTVAVDGTIPWLQGVVARQSNFDPSAMVLAETTAYVLGGLGIASIIHGRAGVERCFSPRKYLMYLPASLAFSVCNILTYIAVKGVGASQFVLLVQLRVVVVALLGRFWLGQKRSIMEWVTLVQLVLGMLVLVDLEAVLGRKVDGPKASDQQWYSSVAALGGVICLCGFAYVFMEGQLKAMAAEPLYIQQHQLSFFGCAMALWLFMTSRMGTVTPAPADGVAVPPNLGFTMGAHLDFRLICLLLLIIARGVLTSFLLKKLDSVVKGLVDVASIVYCAGLQICLDGVPLDFATLGLQGVVLLSIMQYFMLRNASKDAPEETVPLNIRKGR